MFATCKAVSQKIACNDLAEDEKCPIVYETFRPNNADTISLDPDSNEDEIGYHPKLLVIMPEFVGTTVSAGQSLLCPP